MVTVRLMVHAPALAKQSLASTFHLSSYFSSPHEVSSLRYAPVRYFAGTPSPRPT